MIKIYYKINGVYGYSDITMNINKILGKCYNHKRIYHLMKPVNLQSVIRKKREKYTTNNS
ncbi:transposase [Clostridioides sp. ES-S-0010-02]|uniref:transposase n=1 Tax=Clostridioides sp. ES-S-0010-02 TaxID=2770776 RepID=UPI0039BD7C6E